MLELIPAIHNPEGRELALWGSPWPFIEEGRRMETNNDLSKREGQITVQLNLKVQVNLHGASREAIIDYLVNLLQNAVDDGRLAGDTDATVERHELDVAATTCDLDADMLADFMLQRIESGDLALEDLPVKLVTYGLMNPAAFTEEMAERMGHHSTPKVASRNAALAEVAGHTPNDVAESAQRRAQAATVARATGVALETAFPFGYSSNDTEP